MFSPKCFLFFKSVRLIFGIISDFNDKRRGQPTNQDMTLQQIKVTELLSEILFQNTPTKCKRGHPAGFHPPSNQNMKLQQMKVTELLSENLLLKFPTIRLRVPPARRGSHAICPCSVRRYAYIKFVDIGQFFAAPKLYSRISAVKLRI